MLAKTDFQLVVKHISNGTFGENMCRICLLPLNDLYENIFTKVCRENEEHCIADILKEMCSIEFLDNDHFNVCSNCFVSAWDAYKFYLNMRRNDEILHFYTDSLLYNLDSIETPKSISRDSLCIALPIIAPDIPTVESNPRKICLKKAETISHLDNVKSINTKTKNGTVLKAGTEVTKRTINETSKQMSQVTKKLGTNVINKHMIDSNAKSQKKEDGDDDELVIIMDAKGQPLFYKMQQDGQLVEVEFDETCRKVYQDITEKLQKQRVYYKKRDPMTLKKCSRCPVEYKFVAKLQAHMLQEHGITLNSCKICRALIEDEEEYEFHLKTHTNEYKCDICDHVFRKRETMIFHMAQHSKYDLMQQGCTAFVCTYCGKIAKDEGILNMHREKHNVKGFTCYYCGRMYKKEPAFNNHIKKHEMVLKKKLMGQQPLGDNNSAEEQQRKVQEWTCEICGRVTLSERALLWHLKLHTDDRPYKCKVCSRGFVCCARCRHHERCAHEAPALRCPLCPALFHMRSMVNAHIKKVHLRAHKHRARAVRARAVAWRTRPVPVQELSVAIQADILDLQVASRNNAHELLEKAHKLNADSDEDPLRTYPARWRIVDPDSVSCQLHTYKFMMMR